MGKIDDRRKIAEAEEAREVALAHILAAQSMRLIDDVLGQKLPDELWRQMIDLARLALKAVR